MKDEILVVQSAVLFVVLVLKNKKLILTAKRRG